MLKTLAFEFSCFNIVYISFLIDLNIFQIFKFKFLKLCIACFKLFNTCVLCISVLFAFVNSVNTTPGMLYPMLNQVLNCLFKFNLSLNDKFL